MKTILVPTDFSENADNALEYAISLAKKEKSKIILVHAFHITYIGPDVPIPYSPEQLASSEENAKKRLDRLCAKLESEKIVFELVNQQGMGVELILETIDKKTPDLVVMGTKGATGIKEIIVGTNTAKVIEKATCPVIAVPEKALFTPIKNIAYATDYHDSDIDALKKIVEIGELFDSRITLIHTSDGELTNFSEEEYLDDFRNKVKSKINYDKMFFKLVYGKNIVKVLEEYIRNETPDLFSMSVHYRNLFEKIFGTSPIKKLLYHTKIPLLAFHHAEEAVLV